MEYSFSQGGDKGGGLGYGTEKQRALHKSSIQTMIELHQKFFLDKNYLFGTKSARMWVEAQRKNICKCLVPARDLHFFSTRSHYMVAQKRARKYCSAILIVFRNQIPQYIIYFLDCVLGYFLFIYYL